jgi:GDP-L-fucose synthase
MDGPAMVHTHDSSTARRCVEVRRPCSLVLACLVDLSAQRILVTGAHGFLGRALVAALSARGCAPLTPTSRELDLLDRGAVRAWLARHRPTLVMHLAARVGGIGKNQKSPADIFHDNIVMGVQLLDEAHRAGVAKTVAVGTVCAYPKHTKVPFSEDDLWLGYPEETNAPYGLAKKMLLVQAQAYRAQHGMNAIVLFPANLYGPHDNFDLETSHVIPALIRKMHAAHEAKTDVTLWGDGSPTREFLYVDDCAEALCLAAERYDGADPVNVGVGGDISIRALAEKIGALVGFTGAIRWDTTRPNGQPVRRLDTTRARERFGFVARTNFDEGLRRTVEWWLREGRQ